MKLESLLEKPCFSSLDKNDIKFIRIHQAIALEKFHELSPSELMAMLVLPTGAGKTYTVLDIMKSLKDTKRKLIFAVPFISLAEQTLESAKAINFGVGIWYGNKRQGAYNKDTIMVIKTLINRVESGELDLSTIDTIFIDEFHKYNTPWEIGKPKNLDWLIKEAHKNNCRVVGMTGTPYDKDGRPLNWSVGAVHLSEPIHRDINWYIKEGYLSPIIWKVVGHVDQNLLKPSKTSSGVTSASEDDAIAKSNVNEAETIKKMKQGATLVICKDIAHTKRLQKELKDIGVKAGVIHSQMRNPLGELERFKKGEYEIILSVKMLTTGVDIPNAVSLFLCTIVKNEAEIRQILGRVGRKGDKGSGKTFGIVFDLYNTIGLLTAHPLSKPNPKPLGEYEEREPKYCENENCKCLLNRVTIETIQDEGKGTLTKIMECRECGFLSEREEALAFLECDNEECQSIFIPKSTHIVDGWTVCDCEHCGKSVKIEKLEVPSVLVAYRNRLDAVSTLSLIGGDIFQENRSEIETFFLTQDKERLAYVMGVIGDAYTVRDDAFKNKVIDRIEKVNEEFKGSRDIRDVYIKNLIRMGKRHLVDRFDIVEELNVSSTPMFPTIQDMEMFGDDKKLIKRWIKRELN